MVKQFHIKELISKPFNRADYIRFLKTLFEIEPENQSLEVTGQYSEFINSGEYLGDYEMNREKIFFYIINLKNKSVERARVFQRNFIAGDLRNHGVENALVVFYNDDQWRISFVKREKVEGKEQQLSAKRYSFFVGENEINNTCVQRINLLLEKDKPSIKDIEEAFSVEKVKDEFFKEYKSLFDSLLEEVKRLKSTDKLIKEEFTSKNIAEEDFAKKILGQIVFLYFLQKKGWLGVERDPITKDFKEFGDGRQDFVQHLFNLAIERKKNFFNEYLERLFYNALANSSRKADGYEFELDGEEWKIPFLNGSLFEPIGDYDWKKTDVKIANRVFKEILEVFNKYNFTVREDEPMEKEVAIDPEMLGKVFENLLETKERKSTGSFYTPREIVHYMCQQSLINYLETNTNIAKEVLDKFVTEDCSLELPKEVEVNAKKLDELLQKIKIVDPAVGSGAFLVGMMTEIVKARSYLNRDKKIFDLKEECIENNLHGVDISPGAVDICQLRLWLSLVVDEENYGNVKPLPNLDYKIMCGNSLIEDYKGMKLWDDKWIGIKKEKINKEKELKIIEDKIRKLKSEIPFLINKKEERKEKEKEIRKLEKGKKELMKSNGQDTTLFQSDSERKLLILKDLHEKFTHISDRSEKQEYKKKIEAATIELIKSKIKEGGKESEFEDLKQIMQKKRAIPFFLWKMNFIDVFQRENPGFDVVIANPPYVRQEEILTYKEYLNKEFEVFSSRADLYTYFYEKGINLLREFGVLAYISSNKFMRAKYGDKLRNYLKNKTKIMNAIDFGDVHMFEAITNTMVLVLKKEIPSPNNFFYFAENISGENTVKFNQIDLKTDAWTLADKETIDLKDKIEKIGIPLSNWDVKISYGIKAGYNEAFMIEEEDKENLIKKNSNLKAIIKPVLRGRDIGRYLIKFAKKYIIISKYKGHEELNQKYPEIVEHLKSFESNLKKRGQVTNGQHHWLELDNNPNQEYLDLFNEEKIIWIELTDKNKFTFSKKGEFILAGAFMMTGESLKYLLSFLNSKLCLFYFNLICNSSGMNTTQWKKFVLDRIPIKKLSKNKQKPFIEKVDKILNITKDEDYLINDSKKEKVKGIEKGIDKMVYELYELAPEEIKIIEGFGK